MEESVSFLEKLKKESQGEQATYMDSLIMVLAIGLYSVYRVMWGTLKTIFGFFIGLFGIYVYLGLIGVVLVWVLDAILHGIAGR